jgi:hypothetical protein
MIDISLAGLLGAVVGTLVAATAYYLSIGPIEQLLRRQERLETAEARNRQANEIALLRRVVLTVELAICAGAGYWLAQRIWD